MKKKKNMGFIHLKKISFVFLLFSAAIFSTSFAGRLIYCSKFFMQGDYISLNWTPRKWPPFMRFELESWEQLRHDEVGDIHERLLKVKTNDYGKYDPAPTLGKPPFKLIPN
ncbi:hypothetical protein Pfo_004682 [Paulownia fortunei]|nr:hypothetical protein Pfo_004682 [Paulownia fortunei]